jgi:ZIP family zinc transporter
VGVLAGASSNVILGTIAGITIFLGLPVARWKDASERLKGILALASAGVLLFLIIEVGYHAIEIVESSAKSGAHIRPFVQGALLIIGLFAGLVGLAWLEENRHKGRAEGATPFEIAQMIAVGIGLHNFAEGLAIGQSFSGGQTNLGLVLVIGFALHNATEGFGIAGPLVGQSVPWSKLIGLGLIAGAPTAVGAAVGGVFVNESVELLFLSLAVGSLIYVTRELLKLKFASLPATSAMSALAIGLIFGIGTEVFVEVASTRNAGQKPIPLQATRIRFEDNEVEPTAVEIARGQQLVLINETDKSMEFEGHGLMAQEAFVPAKSKMAITIIGTEGHYSLSPEGTMGRVVSVTVLPGEIAPLEDQIQAVAALITLEGHVRAAIDLHLNALNGKSKDAALDLQRAGKHAHHPMHELLEEGSPKGLMVQHYLAQHSLLHPLKEKLTAFSTLAKDKDVSPAKFTQCWQDLLATVAKARNAIGGQALDTDYFKKKTVLLVLSKAEDEYKETVEDNEIEVIEPAVPGKDEYLEYQDTRGFLHALREFLGNDYESMLSGDARAAFSTLLDKEFAPIDPRNPEHPTPFKEIEELFERIETGLS